MTTPFDLTLLETLIAQIRVAKENNDNRGVRLLVNQGLLPFGESLSQKTELAFLQIVQEAEQAKAIATLPLIAALLLEDASHASLRYLEKIAYDRYHLAFLLLRRAATDIAPSLERQHQLMLLQEVLQLPKQRRSAS